ncbi:hypothetical protein ABVT39_026142 [Epinephelus coioides]
MASHSQKFHFIQRVISVCCKCWRGSKRAQKEPGPGSYDDSEDATENASEEPPAAAASSSASASSQASSEVASTTPVAIDVNNNPVTGWPGKEKAKGCYKAI